MAVKFKDCTAKDTRIMSSQSTASYRNSQEVVYVDFSTGVISSDGAIVLLEKFERKYKLSSSFSVPL